MPITYPPAPASISGDVVSISRFLENPTLVARALRTLAQQRFVSDAILTGRFEVSGGAILYEQNESIYADRAPRAIAPGAEYPLTTVGTGPAQLAKVDKWGEDALIFDETIKRQRMDPVQRAFRKMVNQLVKTIDSMALSVIASQVTQSTDASGGGGSGNWAVNGTATIWRDVARAIASIRGLNQGYEPDTLLVDDATWANIISDDKIALLLRRESPQSPIYSGDLPEIGNLRIMATPNLPVSGKALVLDSTMLGGMADEKLGGPGYVSADGVGVEAKTMRQDEEDGWRIRCRRVTVPIVLEPASAWFIAKV